MKHLNLSATCLVAVALLASCALDAAPACDCVRRQASGDAGGALDLWVNSGLPASNIPPGSTAGTAYAELLFYSITGSQGVEVNVCNQHRLSTAIEIEDFGPHVFPVPPGCAINLQCQRREHTAGGCQVDYRFRWLAK